MKTLLTSILLFIYCNLYSQFTITNAYNPAPGDNSPSIDCDTNGVAQGNSGANQTWNFSNLVRTDSSSIHWLAASSTPYFSQFSTSNIASTADDSNYQYFISSSSNITVSGYAGTAGIIPYSDPQQFLVYPFSYNNTFNDNFEAAYTISGISIHRTGTTTVTADAWGTISLPFGTFSNSLRLKYIVITKDSALGGIPLVTTTTLTSYSWFVPGKKFPVFEIIYSTANVGGFISSSKHVSYNPNNPTIGITNLSSIVADKYELGQNYPNPFNPTTNIQFAIPKSGFVSLKIYNMLGKEVVDLINENLNSGIYKYDFDASNLSNGIYFYTLRVNGFEETKKMTLVK